MAAEAHALAHTVYWTSSRGYFSAIGRPVEKKSTGRPVEWFYWTSSRTDDLGHFKFEQKCIFLHSNNNEHLAQSTVSQLCSCRDIFYRPPPCVEHLRFASSILHLPPFCVRKLLSSID